jgi:hypothetical protein
MKPRLTDKVLSGLGAIAGVIEAGSSADVLGYDEEQLDAEGKRTWDEIQTACQWIRGMQNHRAIAKAESK